MYEDRLVVIYALIGICTLFGMQIGFLILNILHGNIVASIINVTGIGILIHPMYQIVQHILDD